MTAQKEKKTPKKTAKKETTKKTKKSQKNVGGRPTKFSEELGIKICDRVASTTLGLSKMCEKYDDMPTKETIYQWRADPKKKWFSDLYAQAKLKQVDILAEECLEIADDSSNDTKIDKDGYEVCNTEYIARSRLRIDTRKWMAAKLLPKQYGNLRTVEALEGENDVLRKELKELRKELDDKHEKEY